MEEGTEKKVSTTTGFITEQLMMSFAYVQYIMTELKTRYSYEKPHFKGGIDQS